MIVPGDLAAMQAMAARRWAADGPYVEHHVGDLAWGANPTTGTPSGLLLDGGYAFDDGGTWHLGGGDAALPAMVAAAREAGVAVMALESERGKVAALRHAGYAPGPEAFHHCVHDLCDLPPFPDGVVSGATDPDRRVALHRAAWHPSRFTRAVYDGVRATPPYDPELDVVVAWRAYALAWYDAQSRSGELEPVGTDPAHRRAGWGARACVAALHRLRERGATTAVVYAIDDPANPGPRALYESVGFVVRDRHVGYLPPTGQNAAP